MLINYALITKYIVYTFMNTYININNDTRIYYIKWNSKLYQSKSIRVNKKNIRIIL